MTDEIPRRRDVRRMVAGELAIRDAIRIVEDMPADVRLTRAVVLLSEAKERVADFVDGIAWDRLDEIAARAERIIRRADHPGGTK